MPPQITLDIGKRAGLEPSRRMAREVAVDNASESHRRLRACLRPFDLRVGPQMDLRQHVSSRAGAPRRRIELLDGAERHAALLRPDAILRDPGSLAAIADPQAEAAQAVIEEYLVRHARGQFELLDRCRCQFHGGPHVNLGSTWEALGSSLVTLPERLSFPISASTAENQGKTELLITYDHL